MTSRNWDRNVVRDTKNTQKSVDVIERISVRNLGNKLENELWQQRLKDIMNEPIAWKESKALAKKSLEYLQNHPDKVLSFSTRKRFSKIEQAIRIIKIKIKEGVIIREKPTKVSSTPKRAFISNRKPLPDWMNNPTLLPKSPPSVKKETEEE